MTGTETSPPAPAQIIPWGCSERLGILPYLPTPGSESSQCSVPPTHPTPPQGRAEGQVGVDKGRKPRLSSGKQRHPSPEMAF